jgi:hypothetical protein
MKQICCLCVLGATLIASGQINPAPLSTENFQKDWHTVPNRTAWKAISETEVQFTHPLGHTKSKTSAPFFARALEQAGMMQYAWSVKQADFQHGCAFYFFSSDATARDAYALWLWQSTDKATDKKLNRLNVDKITSHKLVPIKSIVLDLNEDEWNNMMIRFESAKGNFTVICNGAEVMQCSDSKPFTKGSFVALESTAATATFKDMHIQRLP